MRYNIIVRTYTGECFGIWIKPESIDIDVVHLREERKTGQIIDLEIIEHTAHISPKSVTVMPAQNSQVWVLGEEII